MGNACALTTVDNPFNPFTQYAQWHLYDESNHHDCASLLARFANISDAMTDEENNMEIERAIDEIIASDLTGLYKKLEYTQSPVA